MTIVRDRDKNYISEFSIPCGKKGCDCGGWPISVAVSRDCQRAVFVVGDILTGMLSLNCLVDNVDNMICCGITEIVQNNGAPEALLQHRARFLAEFDQLIAAAKDDLGITDEPVKPERWGWLRRNADGICIALCVIIWVIVVVVAFKDAMGY